MGEGKLELSNLAAGDVFTAMFFFVYVFVFLFYFLACGALSTLIYHLGPVTSRGSLVP
jgi:hypothetical protein